MVKGDRVRIVAPASPVRADLLVSGSQLLRSWGLTVEVAPGVEMPTEAQWGHLAGPDAVRARDLVDALTDPGVSAVLCARGGTGVGRVLEVLTDDDWHRIQRARPRLFVGSSDITALHCALGARAGWSTVFGPMPATEVIAGPEPDEQSIASLHDALFPSDDLTVLTGRPLVGGTTVRAPVVGGTLTIIESLLGTGDEGAAEGCLVLLEDIAEAPRRLDRSLTHLRRSGWLDGARGVLVGSLHDCGATAATVVAERVSDLGIPVTVDLALGHGRPQLSVPLGLPVTFEPSSGQLSW